MIKKKRARFSPTPCSYRNQGAQLYWRRGRQCLHFSNWKMMTKPRNLWLLPLIGDDQCPGSRWEAGNYLQWQSEPKLADPQLHSSTRRESKRCLWREWRSQSGVLTCCQGLVVAGQSYGPETWRECWAWSSPQTIDPAALPCGKGETWSLCSVTMWLWV